jgi:hypothetical protein
MKEESTIDRLEEDSINPYRSPAPPITRFVMKCDQVFDSPDPPINVMILF